MTVWVALVVSTSWSVNESAVGETAIAGTPVPLKVICCGLPAALSEMEMLPISLPSMVGVYVTEIVQLSPAPSDELQLFVCAKSPVVEKLMFSNVPVPVLVSVTVWAALVVLRTWLPKLSVVAERLTNDATPVPCKAIDCGLPEALSVIATEPRRRPSASGANVIAMAQFAPAATEVPQLLVCPKSPAATIEMTVRVAVPVLVSVTLCAELDVPTCWPLNVKLVAERLTAGARPVPVRPTVCGLLEALSIIVTVPLRVPVVVGVKVAEMVQLALAASEAGQLLV